MSRPWQTIPERHGDQTDAERLELAIDLHDAGVTIMRESLTRRMPGVSKQAIEDALQAWLVARPGAELGDGDGEPGTWPRRR